MYNTNYQELYHHGIIGQKWGVRRYQNYDGSYTRAGLKRYEKSKAVYEDAEAKYARIKKDKSRIENAEKENVKIEKSKYKSDVHKADLDRRAAKRQMNKDYKHLKQDKLGDEGKALYAKGKTITGNDNITSIMLASAGFVTGASRYLSLTGMLDKKIADILTVTGAGIGVATTIKRGVDYVQAKKLRAYYTHTSNY